MNEQPGCAVVRVWQERSGEFSWRCASGAVYKHIQFDDPIDHIGCNPVADQGGFDAQYWLGMYRKNHMELLMMHREMTIARRIVQRVQELLTDWKRLGTADGVHGRQLRETLEGETALPRLVSDAPAAPLGDEGR